MRKLEGLQWLRAIAALAVVAFHVEITMAKQKYFGLSTFPLANVGFSGVHLFFVLSGFVIFWAHRGDLGRSEVVSEYFWKRIRRLIPPLWVLLLPLLIAWWAHPAGVGGKGISGGDFVSAFLVFPAPANEVLDVEWTLRHEVVFYLFFSLLILNLRLGILVLFVWFVLCFVSFSNLPPQLSIVLAEVNVLFLLGAATYFVVQRFGVRARGGLVLLTAVLWCLAIFYAFVTGANVHGRSSIYIFGPPSALAVFCAVTHDFSFDGWFSGVVSKIGDASYAIYLVHFPVISILCKLAIRFDGLMPREFWFFAILLVSVLAGQIFHVVAERPLVRWLSKYNLR